MVQPLWKMVWRYLRKLYIELPYDPALPLLGIYPEKTLLKKDRCTHIFTITKTWKQPKCPSTDDWIRKMWYIYTMEYCSAIKKNEIMPFAAARMELEILILSELSQKEKDTYPMIPLISGIYYMAQMNLSTEKKLIDLENRLVVARRRGEWGGLGIWG